MSFVSLSLEHVCISLISLIFFFENIKKYILNIILASLSGKLCRRKQSKNLKIMWSIKIKTNVSFPLHQYVLNYNIPAVPEGMSKKQLRRQKYKVKWEEKKLVKRAAERIRKKEKRAALKESGDLSKLRKRKDFRTMAQSNSKVIYDSSNLFNINF